VTDSGNCEAILVVDDEPLVSDILAKSLASEGYTCHTADCAENALDLLEQNAYALLISDIMMPGKTGIELLSIVKDNFPDLAVIMVTAVDDRKTAVKALQLGAYGYIIKPFDLKEIAIEVVNALERRRLSMESKRYEKRLEEEVKSRTADLHRREEEICLRLTAACEYRDVETASHNRRLGLYAFIMADTLGWPGRAMDEIRIAASMHDIGKIGVPDNILLKPGRLTDTEFDIIKTHTTIGAEILSGSEISLLKMAEQIALAHHEKWNGSGYPYGLAGEDIPEAARMVAVLDVYDALVHKRVYRPPLSEEEALGIMRKDRAEHFDPRMFDIFMTVLPQIRHIKNQVRDKDEE
jgi:putative two-component system response regulator